jgi:hypothetical protein
MLIPRHALLARDHFPGVELPRPCWSPADVPGREHDKAPQRLRGEMVGLVRSVLDMHFLSDDNVDTASWLCWLSPRSSGKSEKPIWMSLCRKGLRLLGTVGCLGCIELQDEACRFAASLVWNMELARIKIRQQPGAPPGAMHGGKPPILSWQPRPNTAAPSRYTGAAVLAIADVVHFSCFSSGYFGLSKKCDDEMQ